MWYTSDLPLRICVSQKETIQYNNTTNCGKQMTEKQVSDDVETMKGSEKYIDTDKIAVIIIIIKLVT